MPPDPKGDPRIVDVDAVRSFLLGHDACCACGSPSSNSHHVVQKGSPHHGDDVPGNLVAICGTGTMRCHGAIHGTPYTVYRQRAGEDERRDAEWVARRIGQHIADGRPDVIEYVLGKLGRSPGLEYLQRTYYIDRVPVIHSIDCDLDEDCTCGAGS